MTKMIETTRVLSNGTKFCIIRCPNCFNTVNSETNYEYDEYYIGYPKKLQVKLRKEFKKRWCDRCGWHVSNY